VLGLPVPGQLWVNRACYVPAIDRPIQLPRSRQPFTHPLRSLHLGPLKQNHSTGHSAPEADLGGVFGRLYAREGAGPPELGAVLLGDRLEIGVARSRSHGRLSGHWIENAQG